MWTSPIQHTVDLSAKLILTWGIRMDSDILGSVKQLIRSYYVGETILLIIMYTHSGNLV